MKRMDLDPNIYPRHKSPTSPATKETDLLKRVEQAHYTAASKQPAIFSSIAAIPKDGGTLVRLIHDGSHPEGRKRYEWFYWSPNGAMNDFTDHQME